MSDNPYDKADAIEKLLRTYKYNQGISAPPAGQDGVDYFLFDVKEGYCDYYASAMVVMLRSVGVPARFVVGYTPGQLKQQNEQTDEAPVYRVLERNAHAWPEVYFPSLRLDSVRADRVRAAALAARARDLRTTSMPAWRPTRPAGANTEADMPNEPPGQMPLNFQAPSDARELWLRGHWGWLAAAARRWSGRSSAAGATCAGSRSTCSATPRCLDGCLRCSACGPQRLHVPWRPSQTPLERAAAFNARLPEAAPAVDTIATPLHRPAVRPAGPAGRSRSAASPARGSSCSRGCGGSG